MPSYKSYCWSLGTTSFRRKELNKKIENQLKLLKEFWESDDNKARNWDKNLQIDYYDFLREKGFVIGNAPNKDKDAREKTSGLVDLGLLTNDRKITEVGKKLLEVVDSENFNTNNQLKIPKDCFIYLKQLLKMTFKEGNDILIRPFVVIILTLCKYKCISYDEFSLLPLIINLEKKDYIFKSIDKLRLGTITKDEIILNVLYSMKNYQDAKSLFINNEVTEDIIVQVGMNRDGGDRYDRPYYKLYCAICQLRKSKSVNDVLILFDSINVISQGCRPYWKKLLFPGDRVMRKTVQKIGIKSVDTNNELLTCNTNDFKDTFFKFLHLFKAKNLLDNYADLNKRILKTTNIFLFEDDTVKFDILPHCYFNAIATDKLIEFMNKPESNLFKDTKINEISSLFNITNEQIYNKVEEIYGVQVRNLFDIQNFVENDRYSRFNSMVDTQFTNENLLQLLNLFENRNKENDSLIQSMVSNNADIPTIFEYVLSIIWYKISDRQGKVLEYMNLSLDADLLPITHASGGHEDITYKYDASDDYPKHTLLIEATLANGTNQRRMEMEPVSRHLGDYMLCHRDEDTYCLFASTYLHINVVSDFRNRKTYQYYSNDGNNEVNGMKIIPLQTTELKTLIQNNIHYTQLYSVFEQAHNSNTAPNRWYQEEVVNKIKRKYL